MTKFRLNKDNKIYHLIDSWHDITFEKFIELSDVAGDMEDWFYCSIANKYNGLEFDFNKKILNGDEPIKMDKLKKYYENIRNCIKPLIDCAPEIVEELSEQQILEIWGLVEPFYASLLVQDFIGFQIGDRMKAIFCDTKYDLLNTGVQIFGKDWKQKQMSVKSETEALDLMIAFDEKTKEIRDAFLKMSTDRFSFLPLLAAVMTTPIYDEEEVLKKSKLFNKTSMQELFNVFFYSAKLLEKYKRGFKTFIKEKQPTKMEVL